jgi:dipeptidyl aminopeptidase/acylaminoacyl peptidase
MLLTVGLGASPAGAAFPGANGRLVFAEFASIPDEGESDSIRTVTRRGSGERTILSCDLIADLDCDGYGTPSFDASGARIALSSGSSLATVDADGSNLRVLAQLTANDAEPAWSRDGQHLAFTGVASQRSRIFVVDRNGEGVRALPAGRYGDSSPAWSPRPSRGGGLVAFSRCMTRRCGRSDLFLVRADGTGLRRLTFRGGDEPSWAPGGRRLAFERCVRRTCGVYTIGLAGRRLHKLLERGAYSPAWSPDGKRIAFLSGSGALRVTRANGRAESRLVIGSPTYGALGDPDWQPRRKQALARSAR